jgi:hypothetical protein
MTAAISKPPESPKRSYVPTIVATAENTAMKVIERHDCDCAVGLPVGGLTEAGATLAIPYLQ